MATFARWQEAKDCRPARERGHSRSPAPPAATV